MLVEQHKNLKALNTFGLNAVADYYCRPTSISELREVFGFIRDEDLNYLVLGGGSNILFKSERYSGAVIHLDLMGITISSDNDYVCVRAGASEVWNDFVGFCIREGINGLENLSLIPGSVGASPVQNIGAYGVEVSDYIESVECYDPETDSLIVLSNEACLFAYRDSIFKHDAKGMVILFVTFKFPRKSTLKLEYGDVAERVESKRIEQSLEAISAELVSQVITEIRSDKLPDPSRLGNVGSFFKNPIVTQDVYVNLKEKCPGLVAFEYGSKYKLAAGWMIDYLGFKGMQVGGAAVHDRQALVLVNKTGAATVDDLFSLVAKIQAEVKSMFGVSLEIEPITL